MLGKQGRESGDLAAALHHFAAMINCPHSPPFWQAHYLRQFLEVVTLAIKSQVGTCYPLEVGPCYPLDICYSLKQWVNYQRAGLSGRMSLLLVSRVKGTAPEVCWIAVA